MNEPRFWDILAKANIPGASSHEWFESLKELLLNLAPDEILAFRQIFDDFVDGAYKIDLWGAGYLINGGCSDDGFHHFRCWLVGRGEAVYKRALVDPDTLAAVTAGQSPCEAQLDCAAARAWEEKMGRTDFYQELAKLDRPRLPVDEGTDWDFDDDEEMRRRFPSLCRLYIVDGKG